jgi:hypothetical protein
MTSTVLEVNHIVLYPRQRKKMGFEPKCASHVFISRTVGTDIVWKEKPGGSADATEVLYK